ncbi:unnamed protein product [Eruca vesicaria subsp. sativa]|uniref:Uncharacterized protein n=1 Tax=Eruca vesicaria subsp. sativa TaxID=29727 RepID=A0ABC8LXA7_ERUVS|nr:unnamed protein product [Eruca vesicaria subsp. sativa]
MGILVLKEKYCDSDVLVMGSMVREKGGNSVFSKGIQGEGSEEGEIKSNVDNQQPSLEFQKDLHNTQAKGMEVISTDENPDEEFEVMLKEHEEEAMAEDEDYGEVKEQKNAEEATDTVGGEQEKNKGVRRRLVKPLTNTLGSNKMQTVTSLISPRKRTMTKGGARKGDNIKPPDGIGLSNPKPGHSKP